MVGRERCRDSSRSTSIFHIWAQSSQTPLVRGSAFDYAMQIEGSQEQPIGR